MKLTNRDRAEYGGRYTARCRDGMEPRNVRLGRQLAAKTRLSPGTPDRVDSLPTVTAGQVNSSLTEAGWSSGRCGRVDSSLTKTGRSPEKTGWVDSTDRNRMESGNIRLDRRH